MSLKLPRPIYERLLDEARKALPDECCGLLGGQGTVVQRVYAATNQLASPVAYEIAPRELFDIFRDLRAHGLELVAIYHSHPQSDNSPSQRDLECAYYPEVAYIIISPQAEAPRPLRVFRLRESGWEEESPQVTE